MQALTTFSEFTFAKSARFWAFRQMGLFGASMRDVPGLRFWRLLGTGKRFGGFAPDLGRYALLAVWQSEAAARAFFTEARAIRRYRAHARSSTTHHLATLRTSGSWGGQSPFGEGIAEAAGARIAVLTRATLRPARQLAFWRYGNAVDPEVAQADGLVHAVSIGELPILRSGTFSIWESARAIAAFVGQPAHRAAQRARTTDALYQEELFARFAVLASETEQAPR